MPDRKPIVLKDGKDSQFIDGDSLLLRGASEQLKLQDTANSDKEWSVGVSSGFFVISESTIGEILRISEGLPSGFIEMTETIGYDEFKLSSPSGVRLVLNADTNNAGESDTPRIVAFADGNSRRFSLGATGVVGQDADGIALTNTLDNGTALHSQNGLVFGVNGNGYMLLDRDWETA